MSRAPVRADFPSHLTLSITPPPQSQASPSATAQPANVLILLHGFGDTEAPFTSLSRSLNLPETTCLSVRAPFPLPSLFDLPGYHWGNDILFDQSTADLEIDAGFSKSIKVILDDVIGVLIDKCGWRPQQCVFFGFGQGGCVALGAARDLLQRRDKLRDAEFGGLVSIGGQLPIDSKATKKNEATAKSNTPVLMCHGSAKSAITASRANDIKDAFEFVEFCEWKRPHGGDGMPTNKEEMMPIMRFFATKLKSRRGIPDGSVEIT